MNDIKRMVMLKGNHAYMVERDNHPQEDCMRIETSIIQDRSLDTCALGIYTHIAYQCLSTGKPVEIESLQSRGSSRRDVYRAVKLLEEKGLIVTLPRTGMA